LAGACKSILLTEGAWFLSKRASAGGCGAAIPRRNQDKHPWAALAASRIPIANMVLLSTEEKSALMPTCTEPTKMARVDLRELRNGGPAACCRL
jgi:hypothetical protein